MSFYRALQDDRRGPALVNNVNLKTTHPKVHGYIYDEEIIHIFTSAKYAPLSPDGEQLEMCALTVPRKYWMRYNHVRILNNKMKPVTGFIN